MWSKYTVQKFPCKAIVSIVTWNGHVDPAVGWHGEPQVVRVSVNGTLTPTFHEEILLITSAAPILCEDLDIVCGPIVCSATLQNCIHQHILCCWGYDTGNDIGEGAWVLHVSLAYPSQWYRGPGVSYDGWPHITPFTHSLNSLTQLIQPLLDGITGSCIV